MDVQQAHHGAGHDYALSEILPALAQDVWKHREKVQAKLATHGSAAARGVRGIWSALRDKGPLPSPRGGRKGAPPP